LALRGFLSSFIVLWLGNVLENESCLTCMATFSMVLYLDSCQFHRGMTRAWERSSLFSSSRWECRLLPGSGQPWSAARKSPSQPQAST
ncbi:hypothetical protein P7K49_040133, partial [Saguinus oedipus]